ncbi:hypothetical protein POVCU2_0008790 [Plasmodium ovale curtisi]|uniref:Uncharacterized protein n=1 Tax=Plasmodium ovale curtisi TaxID=864141 RepID=A0A1A8VQT3_PLAOA|nr:hypothetical protein POVCU2_0008790 [Plasmodium ovale curtisi]
MSQFDVYTFLKTEWCKCTVEKKNIDTLFRHYCGQLKFRVTYETRNFCLEERKECPLSLAPHDWFLYINFLSFVFPIQATGDSNQPFSSPLHRYSIATPSLLHRYFIATSSLLHRYFIANSSPHRRRYKDRTFCNIATEPTHFYLCYNHIHLRDNLLPNSGVKNFA